MKWTMLTLVGNIGASSTDDLPNDVETHLKLDAWGYVSPALSAALYEQIALPQTQSTDT